METRYYPMIRAPVAVAVTTTTPSRTRKSMVLLFGGPKWKPFVVKLKGDALLLFYATGSHIVYRFYQANTLDRVNMTRVDFRRIRLSGELGRQQNER
jgi:hypothetical protein